MNITRRENEIIREISHDPMISQLELSKKLNISRSSVAIHIMNLGKKGIIKGRGYILAEPSSITVIGGTNIDIHGISNAKIKNGDSNPGKLQITSGGVARNIAENLRNLSLSCKLISAVGDDPHGEFLLKQIDHVGIDSRYIIKDQLRPTSTYMSVVDNTGEMINAVSDMEIISSITPSYLKSIKDIILRSEIIITDTNISEASLGYLFNTFSKIPIFVDPVSTKKAKKISAFLDKIHTLKPNLSEAEAISGISLNNTKNLKLAVDWFHKKGLKRIFISMGKKGIYFSNGSESGSVSLNKRIEVKNVSGAGDASMAALVNAFKKNYGTKKSAYQALIAASLAVENKSTVNPLLTTKKITRIYNEFASKKK